MSTGKIFTPIYIFLLIFLTFRLSAQVGINNSEISSSGSAMLDIHSSNQGLLVPRISTANRNLIPSPAAGLLIYNTTTNHFNYFNGDFWYQVETTFVSTITGTISPGGGVAISADPDIIPDSSAALDASDTIRGFLLTRTTPGAIAEPANGLIIYDIQSGQLMYFFDDAWYPVCAVTTGAEGTTGSQSPAGVAFNKSGADPHHSAIVDVSSPDQGILIPQLTVDERNAIAAVTGLTIFNISSKAIEYYDGSAWVRMNTILPAGITIQANTVTVCEGMEATFTITPVNGGETPQYQWKVNNSAVIGATDETFIFVPSNNDMVTCVMTSGSPCVSGNPAISNTVAMTVNPLLPAGITIEPSANPFCAGTQVTFSSTIVNGGPDPTYQWVVNSQPVAGATESTYTFVPENNNAIGCILTTDAICATGNPASSNIVIMTVNPQLTASITISPSAGMVCAGTQVTFTSNIVNGGTNPTYQWVVNSQPVSGATESTFTFVPENNNAIECILTPDAICAPGNPVTSNKVTMTVNPLLQVTITITPSAGTVCAGTQVAFTSNSVNGGNSPGYQWLVNNEPVSGATNPSYTYVPLNNDQVTCMLTSNAICTTGNPATSNVITMTVNPLLQVGITISPSANPVCSGTPVTFTPNVTNGGSAPLYQWKLNGSNVPGATNANYTLTPVNNNTVACVLTSNAACARGNPATSAVTTMTVNPLLAVSLTITPSATSVCPGTSVIYNTSAVNGGTAPQFQWRNNGMEVAGATNTTFSYNVNSNDLITCVLTSNATCTTGNPATSNTVSMNVNPYLPVSVTVTASSPIVIGSPVTFTAAPVNGGTTPAYQWKVNGTNAGTNNSAYTYTPAVNDLVTAVLTSTATCALGTPATSNAVIILNNPASARSVTIAPSANPVCAGTTVVFTATPVNGGTTPAYQWKLGVMNITGATNATYSFVPVHGNVITCTLTPGGGTAVISNTVAMSVTANVPVGDLVTASAYAVMPGTPVTFTATPANQGTAPSYQWMVNSTNAGTNSPTYTYTPSNNDKVVCMVTSNSNASCLTNNPATSNKIITVVYTTGTACTGIPTVTYGGITYNTVQIGTQCWMRENLNIGNRVNNSVVQSNNSIIEKYCYNDSVVNCSLYGGLYQWNEVMQYVTTAGAQGICPTGWHIPTDAEFATLSTFVGGDATAGGKLKEAGMAHFRIPNTNATNQYGFTALPSGYSYNNTSFNSMYLNGYIHMSTMNSSTDVWFRSVISTTESLNRYLNYKTTAIPVRCLMNP